LNAGQLLAALRERDIRLVADGERLRCLAPPGALTPELSARIKEAKGELLALLANVTHTAGAGAIPRTEVKGRFPLSFTQQRAVLAGRIAGGLPTAFLLRGALDLPALTETLRRIVQRHMPLRTRFLLDGESPEQEVLQEVHVDIPEIDLTGVSEDERQQQLRNLLAQLTRVEFDVRQPPLFKFTLVRLGSAEHVLHTVFNVLTFDGWSFDVFWQEMREGYAAITQGEPWPVAPLSVSYEDFVAWQHKRVTEEIGGQAAFWKNTLGDELPPLPLPTDRPRPRETTTKGKGLPFELSVESAVAIRRFAQQTSTTPQITMLAALYAFLARMGTDSPCDIVIGSPVDARTQPSIEGLVGPFVNLLLLRSHVDLGRTFSEFVSTVRDLCLSAYEHQEYPIEQLDIRSPRSEETGFSPTFQVEFSYQQVSARGSHMGNLSLSQLELESGAATNDLTLWVKDWGERVAGAVEFKQDLFDQKTIEHWVNCYKHLLRELVRNPNLPMKQVDILGNEREPVLALLAKAASDPPPWIARRLIDLPGLAATEWQVVDDLGQLRPFGIPGQLAIVSDGTQRLTDIRTRLQHDGKLTEVLASSIQSAKKIPASPRQKTSDLEQRLELRLCFLLQKMLGLPSVSPEQNFFALGGNSLIAVRLFGAIQEQYGVAMAIGVLFDHPTVEGLARHLSARLGGKSEHGPTSEWNTIVRIQPAGSRLPLFCVAGVGGNPMNMRYLARALGPEQPFYGMQHRGVDGTLRPHHRVEDMAVEFLKDIKGVQPRGPYLLSGFSGGGLAAYEVARKLAAAGDEVALVVLFDTYHPRLPKRGLRDRVTAHWERVQTTGPQYFTERLVARVRDIMARASRTVKANLATATPYKFRHEAVVAAWRIAERQYRPENYSGPILLVKAALPPNSVISYQVDESHGWRQCASGEIHTVCVPGDHTGIVDEINAVATAKAMQPYLDEVAQRVSPPSPQSHRSQLR